MRFTFETFNSKGTRKDVTTRQVDIPVDWSIGDYVLISDNLHPDSTPKRAYSRDEIESCIIGFETHAAWRNSMDAVNAQASRKWDPLLEDDGFRVKVAESLTLGQLKLKDAINPSHYQAYIKTATEELQWLEAMQYLPHFRNPECFLAAVELQVRKYMDRSGQKDNEVQEEEKSLWYHKFKLAYMKNGNKPIRVVDIPYILGEKQRQVPAAY